MEKEEIVKRLTELKVKVTELGYEYIQPLLPINLEDFEKSVKPFAEIEKAFNKQINKLKP